MKTLNQQLLKKKERFENILAYLIRERRKGKTYDKGNYIIQLTKKEMELLEEALQDSIEQIDFELRIKKISQLILR